MAPKWLRGTSAGSTCCVGHWLTEPTGDGGTVGGSEGTSKWPPLLKPLGGRCFIISPYLAYMVVIIYMIYHVLTCFTI